MTQKKGTKSRGHFGHWAGAAKQRLLERVLGADLQTNQLTYQMTDSRKGILGLIFYWLPYVFMFEKQIKVSKVWRRWLIEQNVVSELMWELKRWRFFWGGWGINDRCCNGNRKSDLGVRSVIRMWRKLCVFFLFSRLCYLTVRSKNSCRRFCFNWTTGKKRPSPKKVKVKRDPSWGNFILKKKPSMPEEKRE